MPIVPAEEEKEKRWTRFVAYLRRHHFRCPDLHTLCHKAEHFGHLAYLTFVSVEAHYKWYGKVAAFLCCVTVTSFFVHDKKPDAHGNARTEGEHDEEEP